MKRITKRILVGFCVVCAVALLSNQAWAIALSFSPSTSFFDVGDPINVDIIISGMETDNLAEFSFDISYDDSILTFDSYALGSELGEIDPSDPWADAEEVKREYGLDLLSSPEGKYDAVVLAVAHDKFDNLDIEKLRNGNDTVVYDIKSKLKESDGKL